MRRATQTLWFYGARIDRKIERSGFDSWHRENTLDKPREDGGRTHCGGWLGCVVEEVLEFVRSKVCLDGDAGHAIAHRSLQANKCLAKWRAVLGSSSV